MDPIRQGFISLGRKQAAMCATNPDVYVRLLVSAGSQRSIMKTVYTALIGEGLMQPIEKIPEDRRREFWNLAKEEAKGMLPNDKLIVLAKALYCLDYLLSNQ